MSSNREPSSLIVYVLTANVCALVALGYGVWRWVRQHRGWLAGNPVGRREVGRGEARGSFGMGA